MEFVEKKNKYLADCTTRNKPIAKWLNRYILANQKRQDINQYTSAKSSIEVNCYGDLHNCKDYIKTSVLQSRYKII
jgi:hypothetical protein